MANYVYIYIYIYNIPRCTCTQITRIVKGYHLCRFEVNVGEVFTANKKRGECGNASKLYTIMDNSATYSPSLYILFGYYMQIFPVSEFFT